MLQHILLDLSVIQVTRQAPFALTWSSAPVRFHRAQVQAELQGWQGRTQHVTRDWGAHLHPFVQGPGSWAKSEANLTQSSEPGVLSRRPSSSSGPQPPLHLTQFTVTTTCSPCSSAPLYFAVAVFKGLRRTDLLPGTSSGSVTKWIYIDIYGLI